ncbi:unnamed protein product [Notodromas monacha]|uniref:Uncharacterized protein n=1 Tax=Notodromas monacha TaxID=399045 RepID=A0A7R9GAU7_9CRUS|nr:unnamed protein product [Notodromas monacha]CAG0915625.1 unnamed protein product [Notodromas monacha]
MVFRDRVVHEVPKTKNLVFEGSLRNMEVFTTMLKAVRGLESLLVIGKADELVLRLCDSSTSQVEQVIKKESFVNFSITKDTSAPELGKDELMTFSCKTSELLTLLTMLDNSGNYLFDIRYEGWGEDITFAVGDEKVALTTTLRTTDPSSFGRVAFDPISGETNTLVMRSEVIGEVIRWMDYCVDRFESFKLDVKVSEKPSIVFLVKAEREAYSFEFDNDTSMFERFEVTKAARGVFSYTVFKKSFRLLKRSKLCELRIDKNGVMLLKFLLSLELSPADDDVYISFYCQSVFGSESSDEDA